MEFNSIINPATLLLGTMVWIGIFGAIGIYLQRSDPQTEPDAETPAQKDTQCRR